MAEEEERVSTEVTARVTVPNFGKYRPLERLGTGGMADVFLALASGPFDAKKLVVLKQPRSLAGDSVHMFLDEARLAMRLNHPNIVQTYDVGVQDGVFFLAMEYLEGQPLHRVLSRLASTNTAVDHVHLARIASDALAGLHYAHELADFDGSPLEIVHRDVSPHNLFVTYDGAVKVVDFGIAKASSNVVATESGVLKGKVAYMAPEHASSGAVDRRSDVYSMGVVLWEMIARKRLLKADTPAQLLNKVLTTEAPPISSVVADVHPLLEVVVTRALQRDPEERWPTALAMREALDAYIDTAPKKPRDAEVGELLADLFADDRAEMIAKVRAHAQSGSTPQLHTADESTRRESTASGVRTGMPVVTSTGGVAEVPRRSPLVAIALVVSVISLAIAIFVVVREPKPAPLPAASTPLPPATPATSASVPATSASVPATSASIAPAVSASTPHVPVPVPTPIPAPPASFRAPAVVAHAASASAVPSASASTAPPVRPIETAFPR